MIFNTFCQLCLKIKPSYHVQNFSSRLDYIFILFYRASFKLVQYFPSRLVGSINYQGNHSSNKIMPDKLYLFTARNFVWIGFNVHIWVIRNVTTQM